MKTVGERYSAICLKVYVFSAEGVDYYYYFAVKTEQGRRAAGGKQSGRLVAIYSEA